MADPKDELVPLNLRVPRSLLDGLDAWAEALSWSPLAFGRVTRSDLIRLLLSQALAEHPDRTSPLRKAP